MTMSRRALLWPFRTREPEPAPEPAPRSSAAPVRAGAVAGSRASGPLAYLYASPAPIAQPSGRAPLVAAPVPPGLVPRVLAHACLAPSSFCSICVERCPVPGALVMRGPRPEVDPAACDGCGRCMAVCPAPVLGFELVRRSGDDD